jgi:hypothetical protein
MISFYLPDDQEQTRAKTASSMERIDFLAEKKSSMPRKTTNQKQPHQH